MSAQKKTGTKKTTVGKIDADVLAFTVGKDPELDVNLIEVDCIGTAAHVTMLSKMRGKTKVITPAECRKVIAGLKKIIRSAKKDQFKITARDQDVHMAVERVLTKDLGDLGKKVHTGRSRNDQVALDLKLFGRDQILAAMDGAVELISVLLSFAARNADIAIAGRTHFQPAMPSSVGHWAAAYAEDLLDDIALLMGAYEINDQSPLGAAAGYGVNLPINKELTAKLLGFSRACQTPLHAINSRGKCESVILFAMSQVMTTLSRLSEDVILFAAPELGYFNLPAAYCTGSSIMPQKKNPDVFELIRAKAAGVSAKTFQVSEIVRALPCGYSRDLQETKAPFMEGIADTLASLTVVAKVMKKVTVNKAAAKASLRPEIFATDSALKLVAAGVPFREAYDTVKENIDMLSPDDVGGLKTITLDLVALATRAGAAQSFAESERSAYQSAVKKLLGR